MNAHIWHQNSKFVVLINLNLQILQYASVRTLTLPGRGVDDTPPGRKEPSPGRDNNRAVSKLSIRERPELHLLTVVSSYPSSKPTSR